MMGIRHMHLTMVVVFKIIFIISVSGKFCTNSLLAKKEK